MLDTKKINSKIHYGLYSTYEWRTNLNYNLSIELLMRGCESLWIIVHQANKKLDYSYCDDIISASKWNPLLSTVPLLPLILLTSYHYCNNRTLLWQYVHIAQCTLLWSTFFNLLVCLAYNVYRLLGKPYFEHYVIHLTHMTRSWFNDIPGCIAGITFKFEKGWWYQDVRTPQLWLVKVVK